MKLASHFDVPAAPDKVVALFFDPATMRACLPGCEELEQIDDKTYRGTLVNEVAHVKFKAGFSAEITSVDETADAPGVSVVNAILKGEDRRLGSTIKIDARMTIEPVGQDSRVTYELEMAMWGKLGRLGESVIRRRSVEVEKQFVEALTAVCAGKPIPHVQKTARKTRVTAPAAQATSHASVSTDSSEEGSVLPGIAVPVFDQADRSRDLPFIIAVVAAAFAYGVILGGRRRGR